MSVTAHLPVLSIQSVLWLSWQGALLAVVVAVGLLFAGKRIPARWRYLAWSLVVVRLLLIGSVASSVSLYNHAAARPVAWVTAFTPATADIAGTEGDVSAQSGQQPKAVASRRSTAEAYVDHVPMRLEPTPPTPARSTTQQEAAIGSGSNAPGTEPVETPSSPLSTWTANPWSILTMIWLAGACVVLARFVLQQVRTRRILRTGAEGPADLAELVADLSKRAGLHRPPEVRLLPTNFGPAVSGLFRPVVHLPAWMPHELSRNEIGLVVRHELAHLQRRDVLVLWLTIGVRVVHWFNPCVRPVVRRLNRECELACDERVLAQLDARERRHYGDVLLRVVERSIVPAPAPGLLTFSRHARQLHQRIEAIGDFRPTSLCTNLVAASLMGVLVLAGLTNGTSGTTRAADAIDPHIAAEGQATEASSAAKDEPRPPQKAMPAADTAAAAGLVVSGVCKDQDGKPTPQARVWLYSRQSPISNVEFLSGAVTDERGEFRLELPREKLASTSDAAHAVLVVTSDQHDSHQQRLDLDDLLEDLQIPLKDRGPRLTGRILGHDGKPIPGVWVFFPNPLSQPLSVALSSLTDENGRFEIADGPYPWSEPPPAGRVPGEGRSEILSYALMTMHPDYPLTATQVKPRAQDILIQLRQGGVIEGQVVDLVTGVPAADCVVSAQGIDNHGWYQTQTDAEGYFRLAMNEDRYNIWASAEDRMPLALDSVEVAAGQSINVPDIRLLGGGFAEGRVLDADTGMPILKERLRHPLRVAHYGPARPRSGAAVTSTEVGDDGSYRLRVAPGDNYIYLMSRNVKIHRRSYDPNGNGVVRVSDYETIKLDFFVEVTEPPAPPLAPPALGEAPPPRRPARRDPGEEPTRDWPDTEVGRLLRELEELQNSRQTGELPWERKMRELILLGPDAVPELIAALDETPVRDRMMLRSIPFILRGIGDKRAIPALIRAIPRCYGRDGSDMGYRSQDPELMKFLQEHDNNERDDRGTYSYGRPLNEVFRTLQRWTGVDHGWKEIAHVGDGDDLTPRQRQLRQNLFQECAIRWARWWEEHWHEHVQDDRWSRVNLPPFADQEPLIHRVNRTAPLKRDGGRSNLIAQSVYDADTMWTFFDLDTGRWTDLPPQYRQLDREERKGALAEIVTWAAAEGFDLMGTEVEHEGRSYYALQAIELDAWEIPMSFRQSGTARSPREMIDAGRPVDQLLAHYDAAEEAYDFRQVGLFFYITREGTPGHLFLGVEVKDTNTIPGPMLGDSELNPKGYRKGRRFGLTALEEAE